MTHFTKPAAELADHVSTPGPDSPSVPACFSAPQSPDELGQLGRYRILRPLGAGGMGAVYLAFDTGLERTVALKIMLHQQASSPQARERFLREARAAAMVRCDNVVTVFDVGEANGVPFIAMEHLRGYPLDEYLERKGEVSVGQAMRVARETATGLEAAHKLGLVHRDIKPANLWLEAPKGRLKILDFGLARRDLPDTDLTLTQEGQLIGSPAFMSPEQGRGDKVDHRSDLFSLGVVLYRLVAHKMPFEGKTMMALMTSLATHVPEDVRSADPRVPDALARVIDRLLRKDPAHRYFSASEVLRDLDDATLVRRGSEPAVIRIEPLPEPPVPRVVPVWDGIDDPDQTQAETQIAPRPEPARKGIPWFAWVAIALGGLLPLLLLAVIAVKTPKGTLIIESDDPDIEVVVKRNGAIVRDRTKDREIELTVGDFTIELAEKKEGLKLTTNAFEISKNGKTSVRVRLEKPPAVAVRPMNPKLDPAGKDAPADPSDDPDRAAALYLLSLGIPVEIAVDGVVGQVRAKANLPKRAFSIDGLSLDKSFRGTDADLAVFRGCKNIRRISLDSTAQLTSVGLKHFQDSKNLSSLELSGAFADDSILLSFRGCDKLDALILYFAPVTDKGILGFADLSTLTKLQLIHSGVTEIGLAKFKECKLSSLWLVGTPTTNAGVSHFRNTTTLTVIALTGKGIDDTTLPILNECGATVNLVLHNSVITGKGLNALEAFPKLARLDLSDCLVKDEGLEYLSKCPSLSELSLWKNAVSDAGLKDLARCRNLLFLSLKETKVTAKGIAELHKALPKCRIEWDGGTVQPE